MTRYAAFLRAVMVGRAGLTRDNLLAAFEHAGADDVWSHLATGNVSFSYAGTLTVLRSEVEASLHEIHGRPKPIFIRTVAYLAAEIVRQPFASVPAGEVYERCVTFTDDPVGPLELPITAPRGDAVIFAATPSEVHSITRLVAGRPGNPNLLLEKRLHRLMSTRNWNTVEHVVHKNAGR
jgi:uncharacterized protein (DUF1697 family)